MFPISKWSFQIRNFVSKLKVMFRSQYRWNHVNSDVSNWIHVSKLIIMFRTPVLELIFTNFLSFLLAWPQSSDSLCTIFLHFVAYGLSFSCINTGSKVHVNFQKSGPPEPPVFEMVPMGGQNLLTHPNWPFARERESSRDHIRVKEILVIEIKRMIYTG